MTAQHHPAAAAQTQEKILGVMFFDGTAAEAVKHLADKGGVAVMPASPALLKLNYDEEYRRALQGADLALADSSLLVRLWKLAAGRTLKKVSGISYLKALLASADREAQRLFWVFGSVDAKVRAIRWSREQAVPIDGDCHVAAGAQDHLLLLEIERRRPPHIILALTGGSQEKLGLYLRDYLLYRPQIHCVGAALGFLTGEQRAIPQWAEERQFGWLFRLASQPRMILLRVGIACALAWMVFRYRSELPPLRTRWTDL